MPFIKINDISLYYEEHGSGTETIVFAHGLLWSSRMFDKQIALLKKTYRCITFDFRVQGQTEITQSGYDIDTLTQDVVELIESLDCRPCHFLGIIHGRFCGYAPCHQASTPITIAYAVRNFS